MNPRKPELRDLYTRDCLILSPAPLASLGYPRPTFSLPQYVKRFHWSTYVLFQPHLLRPIRTREYAFIRLLLGKTTNP